MKSVPTAKPIAPTAAMSIEQLDPIADPRWARFVDATPGASVFAHPAWLELLARCYRYKFSALCATGDDGEFVVGMPLARVESRLTGRRLVVAAVLGLLPAGPGRRRGPRGGPPAR